jgi:hypothetical protein
MFKFVNSSGMYVHGTSLNRRPEVNRHQPPWAPAPHHTPYQPNIFATAIPSSLSASVDASYNEDAVDHM